MFRFKYFLVCLVGYFIVESNSAIVSFIKPCKPHDNQCIKENVGPVMERIIPGIPELGVASIDPISIDSVRADRANLKFGLRNIQFYGASKCKIIELARNTKKSTIKLTAECPSHGVGQYDLNGKIFLFDVFGDGDFEIKTDKFRFTLEVKIKYVQKDGRKYWKLTGFDYNYEFLEKVYITLNNLYDGDEVRARPVRDFLDHSWKDFADLVSGPIMIQVVTGYVDVFKNLLEAFPVDQLELS